MVTEALRAMGLVGAWAVAAGASMLSTARKEREEANAGTRRENGIGAPRADSVKQAIFFASRIIHTDAGPGRPKLAFLSGCYIGLVYPILSEGLVICRVLARCSSLFSWFQVLPFALR